jgi:L-alanine-DL-glutamate epimerase-like enolase superfamily enzyme
MSALALTLRVEALRFAAPFRISGFVFEEQQAVVATLRDGVHRGRGEASGVYYLGDDARTMLAEIESVRGAIEAGIDRAALQELLPPGGARNAVDCALWELDACRAGRPVWQLAGMQTPKPLLTTFTLSAAEPAAMVAGAQRYAQARALKLKLTGDLALDIERVRSVRASRPGVWMGVDANQGYTIDALEALIEALAPLEISLLEQPLKRGREADLDGFVSPIPMAADESALSTADLGGLVGRFSVVNIMVGNMVGTSWAMAPAFVIGQLCDVVDLDGPIFLARDRTPAMTYVDGNAWSGDEVWGGGVR